MRVGRRERRQATAVQAACRAGLDCRLGAGPGEERTQNMPSVPEHAVLPMFVTLEVSKLSGWLNDAAFCRESKEGHAVRSTVVQVQAKARLQIQGIGK